MDNATQFQFELLEVAKILLKKQGIKTGIWTIGVNFGVLATHAGPSPDIIRPSMVVSVDKLVISKVDEPGALTIDASGIED